MNLEAGRTLGSYRLIEKIGAGGMGIVWRALDTRLEREVALKVLHEDSALNEDHVRRFRSEAKAVAALNHPNIVTLYSVEEAAGHRFITMELVRGRTLRASIPEKGFALDRFFKLAIPFTDALSKAHEQGVIHRDIKPANIMIGDDGLLKILDFGLAKLHTKGGSSVENEETRSQTQTQAGHVVGTVAYMSPEQLHGDPVDPRTDLFSSGVVLFEMSTGGRPFSGKSSAQLMSAILRDSPPSVTDLKVNLPNHLGRIIRRCLEKDPEHRFQTAKDLRNELVDLRDEVHSSEILRRAPGRKLRFRPGVAAVVTGAMIVLALIALIALRPGPTGSNTDTLAILPFANLTGDSERDYVAQGIGSGLVTSLGEIAGLRVLTSDVASREAARRLGAGTLLEGAVQPATGEIRVDVKLIESSSGVVLWSETFSRNHEDLPALQHEIARRVARVLSVSLSARERRRLSTDSTGSFRAYDFLLRGYRLADLATQRDTTTAVAMFRQAIQEDPEFALAWVALSHALQSSYEWDAVGAKLEEAESAARRALELDPDLPSAQVALARVFRSTGRADESIEKLEEALARHPKPAEAQRELAATYLRVGQLEEAERCLRAAVAMGGDDWFNWNALGAFLDKLGRYDEASDAFKEATARTPDMVSVPHENLATVLLQQGRFEEALQAYEAIPGTVRDPELASNIGTAYYFSNRTDRWEKAEEHYRLAARLNPRDPVIRRNLADLYEDLDRTEDSLHNYREALQLVEEQLADDPGNQPLRLEQAVYAAKARQCDEALPLADELATALARTARDTHRLAQVYALCARDADALSALRTSFELGFSREIALQEREFATLHEHPEFIELTAPGSR